MVKHMDSKKLLKYFFIISAFQSIGANFAHPATPTLIQNLGLNDYMFGVAFAGMSLTNFLFSPFWGKISDQIGRRKVLGLSGLGYAVGQLMFGMATTELGILLGRMTAGFFIGAWNVGQLSYIMDHSDIENKGKNFTLLATIQSVCGASGYLIGGYIAEYSIGLMFICQAVCLSLGGIFFYLLCRDNEAKHFTKSVKVGEALKGSNPFGAFMKVGKQMSFVMVILLAVALIATFSSTAYDQCFNYFIKDQLSFSPSNNGVMRAVLGMVALITNMTVGMWIMKKTNISRSFVFVLAAYSMVLVGLLFPSALPVFVVINIILYSLNTLVNPLGQAVYALGIKDEKQSGVFMGVFNSIKSLGSVIGSLFAGFIYSTGPRLSFLYACVGFAIAALLAFKAYSMRKKEAK